MPKSAFSSLADLITADPDPTPAWSNNNSASSVSSSSRDSHFTSRRNPERLGNAAPIAYGGCIIAVAVNAAFQTLPINNPRPFHLYSVLGAFHGPTKVDRKVNCTVTTTRNTKSFATRRVVASQTQDDNTQRVCADFFIDFHAEEPASLLVYDAQPTLATCLSDGPTHSTGTRSIPDTVSTLINQGHITRAQANAFQKMFGLSEHYLELRHCTAGVSGTNLMGLAPRIATPQDHLSLPEKVTAEWLRTRPSQPLPTQQLNFTALAFFMDQALSFLPLNHDHKGFPDAGACSTLDFALRIFVPVVDLSKWHFRERRTHQGGGARTYNEGRLWDESGKMVASMTQVCILRPPPPSQAQSGKAGPAGRDVKAKI